MSKPQMMLFPCASIKNCINKHPHTVFDYVQRNKDQILTTLTTNHHAINAIRARRLLRPNPKRPGPPPRLRRSPLLQLPPARPPPPPLPSLLLPPPPHILRRRLPPLPLRSQPNPRPPPPQPHPSPIHLSQTLPQPLPLRLLARL